MQAEYDSTANALSIRISESLHPERGDEVHPRAIVAVAGERPVEVQVLYPDLGVDEPLATVADRYGLDSEALRAATQSALAAPDRVVELEVAAKAPAADSP